MLKSMSEETVEKTHVPTFFFFPFLLTEHLLFLKRFEIIYPTSWQVANTEVVNIEKSGCFQAK